MAMTVELPAIGVGDDRTDQAAGITRCWPAQSTRIRMVVSIIWYPSISLAKEALMRAIAKLFTHGRSQAVRLPKEFRFKGTEVRVSKVGERVILEPIGGARVMPWDQIDALGDAPFMPKGREQPTLPAERIVFDE
jgi:antitoxin VapB